MKGSLILSDLQMRLVERAARSLPVGQRDSFLQAVAAQLTGTPADHAVEEAVNVALDRAQPIFMCDAAPKEATMVRRQDDDDAFDENGLLRDGKSTRVPMLLRDGSTVELEDWQREVIWAHRLGLADAADLHRPGPRRCVDQVGLDAKAKAYADSVVGLTTAWQRKPTEDLSGEFIGAREGDVCTVREGGVDEGSPGRLRMVGGKLTCVPDQRRQDSASVPRTMTADAAQRVKDEAWRASVEADESAWRTPPR